MTNKSTVNQRMLQIIEEKFNGNKAAFAKHIGIPPTSISNYFKQRPAIPSADILEKIVSTLDVNAMWILTGEGEMQRPNKCHFSPADTPRIRVAVELELTMEEIEAWGLKEKIIKTIQNQ